MTSQPLRVGIVGLQPGRSWAAKAHVPALRALSADFVIAGIANTTLASAVQAAAALDHGPRPFASVADLVASPDIDVVSVTVRVPHHLDVVKTAITAGKHVYCEWPLGANLSEAEELAALARKMKVRTMVGLQRRASPAYLRMRELVKEGYVGKVLSVNMTQMGSGVLTRTSDRTWQRNVTLGANTLTITFGHAIDALCMVVGEITEVAAVVSTQVPQWFETDTKKYVDVTAPDNIMIAGRLEGGAVVNAHLGVHPYHGTGYRFEIYGTEGTLAMIGGGEAGQEVKRKIMGGRKDDKTLQELPVPDRLKWVPEEVQGLGPSYDVGQMWVKFAEAIRSNTRIEPDFDSAVRRHRMLDAVVRASETGQRQKIVL
jgi:predicted dehydrogenase